MMLFKKILKWTTIVLIGLFIVAEIVRWPFRVRNERNAEQVEKIHNTKLQLSDVMGENLPPDPGEEADDTVAGIDANQNGIRDDVELAIFKEYPNSAKTRGPLLQYALTLQMQFTQPIINEETVAEVVAEDSRAHSCVADTLVPRKTPESSRTSSETDKIDKYIDFIDSKQINTQDRQNYLKNFYDNLRTFSNSDNIKCDIDFSKLAN